MNTLKIADNLVRLRHAKKITQQQLTDFVGVTKASVSKWEKDISKPDITILPVIAAYFGVTIDELIGYVPELSKEQIQRIYIRFSNDFATREYKEVESELKLLIKKYYACHAFILQMCILLFNHYQLAKDQARAVLDDIDHLCQHIIDDCEDIKICHDARIFQTMIQLQMGNFETAIKTLEYETDPSRLSNQSDSLMIMAYLMKNDMTKACSFAQIAMYQHLVSFIGIATQYIVMQKNDILAFEKTVSRIERVIDTYRIDRLNANTVCSFEYQTALVYLHFDNKECALDHLEKYVSVLKLLLGEGMICLHGDDYFHKIDEWIDSLDLGAHPPRDRKSVLKDVEISLENPAFDCLKESERFHMLKLQIKELIV